jgi:hypothetical protein
MVAFEVSVNGKRRYVAGHADAQMLNIWMHGSLPALAAVPGSSFGVLGSVAVPGTAEGGLHTLSYPNDRLSVGDELTIRIIQVDRADPPMKRNTGDGSVEIVADAG